MLSNLYRPIQGYLFYSFEIKPQIHLNSFFPMKFIFSYKV